MIASMVPFFLFTCRWHLAGPWQSGSEVSGDACALQTTPM